MSRLHEPFKLAKHPELLHEINETIISLKLHSANPTEQIVEARKSHKKPDDNDIIDLLGRCRTVINSIEREDHRKY